MAFPKLTVFAFLLTCASCTLAQTVDDGYSNLRSAATDVQIIVTGTDTRNGGSRYRSELTYSDSVGGVQHAEIMEFLGPIATPDPSLPLTRRLVGDGTTMWGYNVPRNAYTALRYGVYKGALTGTYRDDFFHALTSASYGQSSPVARVLADVYEAGSALFKPWFAGSAPMVALSYSTPWMAAPPYWPTAPTGSGYPDLVDSTLIYTPTPTVQYQFVYEPTIQRSLAFEVTQDTTTGNWILTGIYSNQQFATGMAQWHLTVNRTPTIAPNTFTFIPPANSRALATRSGG